MKPRVFIDTDVYVSFFLLPSSVAGKAVAKAWAQATTLASSLTALELRAVLGRASFAPYLRSETIGPFIERVQSVATRIQVRSTVSAWRDPRDDKFIEVAVHGQADAIVTSDPALLAMKQFSGIAILTPAEYLALN
jgi:putative PIN family toxin of toxin-antitoxin system